MMRWPSGRIVIVPSASAPTRRAAARGRRREASARPVARCSRSRVRVRGDVEAERVPLAGVASHSTCPPSSRRTEAPSPVSLAPKRRTSRRVPTRHDSGLRASVHWSVETLRRCRRGRAPSAACSRSCRARAEREGRRRCSRCRPSGTRCRPSCVQLMTGVESRRSRCRARGSRPRCWRSPQLGGVVARRDRVALAGVAAVEDRAGPGRRRRSAPRWCR